MSLASGKYLTKVERKVVVWPAPDANGDGAPMWENQYDTQGRQTGRNLVKDKHGNEVREYRCPEGFQNRPGYDHTDNYVMVDERGEVVRQANGEAIVIKPGQALVFNADGSIDVLQDEYEQYVFGLAHDVVEAGGSEKTVTESSPRDTQTVTETSEDRLARLRAELAAAEAGS